jgi:hypothetical protein
MSAAAIAYQARMFRLLADRPELCCADKAERIERMLNLMIPLSELDRTLVLHATELDHLCAHAIRVLREESNKSLLDTLGILDNNRICALYWALPPKRRFIVIRDPTFGYAVSNAPSGTEAAIADLQALADETQVMQANRARNGANHPRLSEARSRAEHHQLVALRMEVGLPVELTPEERPAAVYAVFRDELTKLGADPDDAAFAAAMARGRAERRAGVKVRVPNPEEHDRCPHCGYLPLSKADAELHAAGLDRKRLSCPASDLHAIKASQRARSIDFARVAW